MSARATGSIDAIFHPPEAGMSTYAAMLAVACAFAGYALDMGGNDPEPTLLIVDKLRYRRAVDQTRAILDKPGNRDKKGKISICPVQADYIREAGDAVIRAVEIIEHAVAEFLKKHGVAPWRILVDTIAALHPMGPLAPVVEIVDIMRALRDELPDVHFTFAIPTGLFRDDRNLMMALAAPADRVFLLAEGRLSLVKSANGERCHLRHFKIEPIAAGVGATVPFLECCAAPLMVAEKAAMAKPFVRTTIRKVLSAVFRDYAPKPAPRQTCEVEDLSEAEIAALHDRELYAYALRDNPDPRIVWEVNRRAARVELAGLTAEDMSSWTGTKLATMALDEDCDPAVDIEIERRRSERLAARPI